MNKTEIFNKLKQIFAIIFPSSKNVDNIKMNDNLVTDLGLNSVAIVYVAFAIEKEFHIDVSSISFKSFTTVEDVVNYINQKI